MGLSGGIKVFLIQLFLNLSVMGILLSFAKLIQPDQLVLTHSLAFGEDSLVLGVVRKVNDIGEFRVFFLVGLQKGLKFLIIISCSLDFLSEGRRFDFSF